MGLFGFGKKKSKKEAEPAVEPVDEDKVAAAEANAAAKAESAETVLAEPASEYQGRGEERGPWDVNDEDVPDYDDYLDLGAYYLPFLRGIQLRIKATAPPSKCLVPPSPSAPPAWRSKPLPHPRPWDCGMRSR